MNQGQSPQALSAERVSIPAGHAWNRLVWVSAAAGVLGTAVSVLLVTDQFYFSWLVSFMYFLSIALGGLFFVLVLFLTRAGWGVVVRRIAENAMATLPLFALMFIPIWVGRKELFHWTHEDAVAADVILQGKLTYLNTSSVWPPGFLARAVIYFALWTLMSLWFVRQSQRQDGGGDHRITRRLQAASGPAIIVYALSSSFAAFDWMMSLDPHWYSTMFGVYYFAGTLIGIFSFMVVVIVVMQAMGLLRDVISIEHFHDLGKLLFAFTVFWAYIAFSQYFLIWYSNLPEETFWYLHRLEGSWRSVSILLAVGHFAVPFFFLMPRTIKRKTGLLLLGALWMLLMHFIDIYWLVMPVLHRHGFQIDILDLTTFIGVGGIFFAAFGWNMRRRALIPVRDPRLPESLAFENV